MKDKAQGFFPVPYLVCKKVACWATFFNGNVISYRKDKKKDSVEFCQIVLKNFRNLNK